MDVIGRAGGALLVCLTVGSCGAGGNHSAIIPMKYSASCTADPWTPGNPPVSRGVSMPWLCALGGMTGHLLRGRFDGEYIVESISVTSGTGPGVRSAARLTYQFDDPAETRLQVDLAAQPAGIPVVVVVDPPVRARGMTVVVNEVGGDSASDLLRVDALDVCGRRS